MITKMTKGFDSLMRRYTPDPFIYAVMLTVLVFALGVLVAGSDAFHLAQGWGRGFWSLATFTLQMVMVLFLGYVVALSPLIRKTLSLLADLPKNLPQAAVYATLISLVGAILNWGFGLIISALYCKELGRRYHGRKFPILVACSYSGFLVWHGGLSGSIPLVISTPGNFSESLIGGVVPLSGTIFSVLNLSIIAAHFVCLPILSFFLMKWSNDENPTVMADDQAQPKYHSPVTPAERLESSPLVTWSIVAIGVAYIISIISNKTFGIDLNMINLLLFLSALILHKTPRGFLDASMSAAEKVWPILVQYPLYAGIMAIMQESGLAAILSDIFVGLASAHTLPLLVYLSAGLLNIFIPSGGGQWAVQGPMVISAANELGANLNASMMAVAWGDAWTNMIQPFWALPLLAVAGLKARDIMSSLVFVFLLSGVITALCFLLLV